MMIEKDERICGYQKKMQGLSTEKLLQNRQDERTKMGEKVRHWKKVKNVFMVWNSQEKQYVYVWLM